MLEKYRSLCQERQKITVSKDSGVGNPSQHRALNEGQDRVRQYCLDDRAIVQNEEPRCDYLVLNDDKKRAYFIELKGRHIERAKAQIENAERLLAGDVEDYARFYRIVYKTGTQSVRSAAINTWIRRMGRVGGVWRVIVANRCCQECIDS